MYTLVYSEKAAKQLKNLNKDLQEKIITALERCRIRPHAHIKKIVGSHYFSLRVGDHRVIIDIQKNELRIFVIKIGRRKNIYS